MRSAEERYLNAIKTCVKRIKGSTRPCAACVTQAIREAAQESDDLATRESAENVCWRCRPQAMRDYSEARPNDAGRYKHVWNGQFVTCYSSNIWTLHAARKLARGGA